MRIVSAVLLKYDQEYFHENLNKYKPPSDDVQRKRTVTPSTLLRNLSFRNFSYENRIRSIGDNAVPSSIRIAQVFPEFVGKKIRAIWKVYGGMLKYIIN